MSTLPLVAPMVDWCFWPSNTKLGWTHPLFPFQLPPVAMISLAERQTMKQVAFVESLVPKREEWISQDALLSLLTAGLVEQAACS